MSERTDALATALLRLDDENPGIIAKFGEYIALDDAAAASSAGYILAALPDDAALVTVGSLGTALRDAAPIDLTSMDRVFGGREPFEKVAAAIIQAAKEAADL